MYDMEDCIRCIHLYGNRKFFDDYDRSYEHTFLLPRYDMRVPCLSQHGVKLSRRIYVGGTSCQESRMHILPTLPYKYCPTKQ